MKEILFRGQNIAVKTWVYGDLIENNGNCIIVEKVENDWIKMLRGMGWNINAPAYKVASDTIGQFTGLTDKNGTKIFEGDILREPPKNNYEKTTFNAYEVFWHDNNCAESHIGWQCNWLLTQGHSAGGYIRFTMLPKDTALLIIIGNIHDNLELIHP